MSIRLPHSFLSLLNNSWVGGFLYQSRQLPPTIPNTMKYLLWKLRLLLKQIEDFRLFQCDVSVCTGAYSMEFFYHPFSNFKQLTYQYARRFLLWSDYISCLQRPRNHKQRLVVKSRCPKLNRYYFKNKLSQLIKYFQILWKMKSAIENQ